MDSKTNEIKSTTDLIYVTYEELVKLRNDSLLKPGCFYCITDYVTTTSDVNTISAGYNFPIIVLATDVNKLSEEAITASNGAHEYFDNSNLNAWKLWYCLDNDDDRFSWAGQRIRKTCFAFQISITEWFSFERDKSLERLIDNTTYYGYKWESGFDQTDTFNNNTILWYNVEYPELTITYERVDTLVYIENDGNLSEMTLNGYFEEFDGEKIGKGVIYRMIDEFGNDCPYDFKNIKFKNPHDESDSNYYYTFTKAFNGISDASVNPNVCAQGNIIGSYKSGNKMMLPINIFCGNYVEILNNTLGNDCHDNIFGNETNDNNKYLNNTFGNGCYNNIFGTSCKNNTFGCDCHDNNFGDECDFNTFGDQFQSNELGSRFQYNTFGTSCANNTFGVNCKGNTFGCNCYNNTFGEYCFSNTFDAQCDNNIFGGNCFNNSLSMNCSDNNFDDGSENRHILLSSITFEPNKINVGDISINGDGSIAGINTPIGSVVCVDGNNSTAEGSVSNADGGTTYYRVKDTFGNFMDGTIAVKNGSKGADGADGADGTSISITNLDQNNNPGEESVITFSDGKKLSIKNGTNGTDGADGKNGKDGTSVSIDSLEQNNNPGEASNIIFSDGNTLSIKNGTNGTNGKDGADGRSVNSIVCVNGINGTATGIVSTIDGGITYYRVKDTNEEFIGGTIVVKNGSKGTNGTSVSIDSLDQNNNPGEASTITFSDGNTLSIKNGINGTDGADGDDGCSVGSVFCVKGDGSTEAGTVSAADGGTTYYRVKDTNGNFIGGTIVVKNGSKGTDGTTASVVSQNANGLVPKFGGTSDLGKFLGVSLRAGTGTEVVWMTPLDTKDTAGAKVAKYSDGDRKLYLVGAEIAGEDYSDTKVREDIFIQINSDESAILNVPNIRTSNLVHDGIFSTTEGIQTTGVIGCKGVLCDYIDMYDNFVFGKTNFSTDSLDKYVEINADGIEVEGGIVASGDIETSGNVTIDGTLHVKGDFNVDIDSDITFGQSIKITTDQSGQIECVNLIATNITVDELTLNGQKVTIDASNGNIEVGENISASTINASESITSQGTITASGKITGAGFYQSSDERLKTFTEDYDINLDNIKTIKTGKFYWNSDENKTINGGVSAQTVEQYFPELVMENENGMKSVNYDGLAVVAIAAIKKLTERIEQLEEIVRNK